MKNKTKFITFYTGNNENITYEDAGEKVFCIAVSQNQTGAFTIAKTLWSRERSKKAAIIRKHPFDTRATIVNCIGYQTAVMQTTQ